MDQLKNKPFLRSSIGRVSERQICCARVILNFLLKTNEGNLTDESLQTLVVEVETIVNSCPLTTETINDHTSLISHDPINLLSIKQKILISPPGIFPSLDKYCRRNWTREQHICMSFGTGGGKRRYYVSNLEQNGIVLQEITRLETKFYRLVHLIQMIMQPVIWRNQLKN